MARPRGSKFSPITKTCRSCGKKFTFTPHAETERISRSYCNQTCRKAGTIKSYRSMDRMYQIKQEQKKENPKYIWNNDED